MATLVKNISAQARTVARRKSVLATTCGLLIGLTGLAITNPGKSAYVDYASQRLPTVLKGKCQELKSDFDVSPGITIPSQDLCKSFVGTADLLGRGAVKIVVAGATEPRQNFGAFSVYTTKAMGRKFVTVGIARNFIMIYGR